MTESESQQKQPSNTMRVASAATLIAIITAFSKVYGFIREAVFASLFGATMQADAFLVALVVPTALLSAIGGALATVFIPVFGARIVKDGVEPANRLANSVLNAVLLISTVFLLVSLLFAEPIVGLVAPGLEEETASLATRLTRIMLFALPFMVASGWVTGLLHARQHFLLPALIGFPYSTIYIAFSIWAGLQGNMSYLAIGVILAYASQFFIQVPTAVHRYRFRYRPTLNWHDDDLRRMGILVLPVLISTGATQLNVIVDRMLASGLATGSIAALNYAQKVNGLSMGLLILPVGMALYPSLVQFVAEKDVTRFLRATRQGLNVLNLILMPILVGIIVLSSDIVRVLFERGAFDARATEMTAFALAFYTLGIIGLAWREVLNRAFFAMQDTKTPMWAGIIAIGINIVLNFLLVGPLGVGGLALATSISMVVGAVILLVVLRKRAGRIGGSSILISLGKTGTAALLMGGVVGWLRYGSLLPDPGPALTGQVLHLGVLIGVGAVIYAVAVFALRVAELELGWLMATRVWKRLRYGKN